MRYLHLTGALFFLCLFGLPAVHSQSIQNVRASFAGSTATLLYDIVGGAPDQKYAIEILGSHNNFSDPLKFVTGDVGRDVTSGPGKKIEWNALSELGTFKGEIVFRLRGTPVVMPIAFKSPTQASAKKGRNALVQWSGGNATQNIQLAVVQGDKVVQALPEMKNTGTYTWAVPKDFEKGEYAFKLTSGSESVKSDAFKVKSKIPFLVYVAPVVVAVTVILLLPDKPPGGGETQDDLPDAPGPK